MSYKFSTGSVRKGDVFFEDDRTGEPTYIDFGQDTITLRPSGSQILHAQNDAVGIGTTSPDYTLDVAGDIGVDENIYHNGDDDTSIQFAIDKIVLKAGNRAMITTEINTSQPHEVTINDGANNVDFVVKGNGSGEGNPGMKFDASTNRLGINGVGTPDEVLHVDGNIKAVGNDVRIKIDGDTDSHPGLELYENGTRKWIVFNDYTNDNLTFKTNSNTRMSIEQGGNVGIGTTAPISKLDVAGKIAITAESATPSAPADGQGYIYSKSDGKLYWRSHDLAETDLTATGSGGGGGGGTPGGSDSMVQYNDGGSFGGAQGLVYDDSNTRVGVGITAPLTTLHVHADTINNGAVTISQADNSGDASQLDLSKARGSGASPTAVQNNDFIGQVRMLGYDGDSYDNFADIYVQAAGTVSTTSHPSKMVIRTTQASATSPTTAVTIDQDQNMTVNGNIYGRMLHMTHHRYNDGSGTGKEYIPWAGTSEQPSPSWITQGVAPYEGKLLKVKVRSSKAGGMGSTTVGIHTNTDGNTVVNSTAEETVTVNMTTANTTYTFTFSNTTHFGPDDIIGVSIDPTNAHGNVNVTCIWEYDITQ